MLPLEFKFSPAKAQAAVLKFGTTVRSTAASPLIYVTERFSQPDGVKPTTSTLRDARYCRRQRRESASWKVVRLASGESGSSAARRSVVLAEWRGLDRRRSGETSGLPVIHPKPASLQFRSGDRAGDGI